MSEFQWSAEYVEMLRSEVLPHVQKAGKDGQVIPQYIDPRYFHRGVVGYAFAASVRRRLQEYLRITKNPAFLTENNGPWKYSPQHVDGAPFYICNIYSDTSLNQFKGTGQLSAKREATEKRTQMSGYSRQLELFTNNADVLRLASQDPDGVPLVCLAYDEAFEIVDVLLTMLVDSTIDDVPARTYVLENIQSLLAAESVFGETKDIVFVEDELMPDVDVAQTKKKGSEKS